MICIFNSSPWRRNLGSEQGVRTLCYSSGSVEMKKIRSYVMEIKTIKYRSLRETDWQQRRWKTLKWAIEIFQPN